MSFPTGSVEKNSPKMQEVQEVQVLSLSQEDPLEEGMATHSSILAWNPMDRGAWQATIHRVTKRQTCWVTEHSQACNFATTLQMDSVSETLGKIQDPHPLFYPNKMAILAIFTQSESEVAQSCLTLCNPEHCSPSGSSIHGILQARILEWVAISFSNFYPELMW